MTMQERVGTICAQKSAETQKAQFYDYLRAVCEACFEARHGKVEVVVADPYADVKAGPHKRFKVIA